MYIRKEEEKNRVQQHTRPMHTQTARPYKMPSKWKHRYTRTQRHNIHRHTDTPIAQTRERPCIGPCTTPATPNAKVEASVGDGVLIR